MKRPFAAIANNEILDALAESRLGRMLEPLTLVVKRNAQRSMDYENTRMLSLAFSYVRSEGVPGDYAEFGVWTGRTFVEAWRVARGLGQSARHFWAFDSFEGLPAIDGVDATGRFAAGEFTGAREPFEARLRRARVPADQVHVVEGFFDATLARPERIGLQHVAVAWIDCDLYASTVPVLDFLTSRLTQGAVLLFDDWFCFKGAADRGEAKACAEWLARNPHISLVPWRQFDWAGQAFIVRLDEDAESDLQAAAAAREDLTA